MSFDKDTERVETEPQGRGQSSEMTVDSEPVLVVGIGASAGGLDPIERLFARLPRHGGMAYIVVQHLSPQFKSLMPELLARRTQMSILVVEDGMRVERDHVYLIPPRTILKIKDGQLWIERSHDSQANFPITQFFRSLAQDAGQRAVGIVLSGSGSDGSEGIEAIHEAGGLTIAQSEESSQFGSMPHTAMATGSTDLVLAPEEIADVLVEYSKVPGRRDELVRAYATAALDSATNAALASIFEELRQRTGVDFGLYKMTTIGRRIGRRMQQCRATTLEQYLGFLNEDQGEFDQLFQELLLSVTSFFRDPEAFDSLRDSVIMPLLKRTDSTRGVRVWIPGCSSGEEPYSVGIEILECLSRLDIQVPVQIFATDIHQRSLNRASAGIYLKQAVAHLDPAIQERYFRPHPDGVEVCTELRRMVVFSRHDVTRDPPFSRTNLVICRNLLIYFLPPAQEKVLSLMHFSLESGGYMWLGSGEGTGPIEDEFDVVDRRWRIFRKRRMILLPAATTLLRRSANPLGMPESTPVPQSQRGILLGESVQAALAKAMPPAFLLSDTGEILYVFGKARDLIRQKEGRTSLNVSQLLEGELRMSITSGLHRVKTSQESVEYRSIRIPVDGKEQVYDLVLSPLELRGDRQSSYLALIEPRPHEVVQFSSEDLEAHGHLLRRISELEKELDHSRGNLQAAIEELQATNEELLASNEELQSTNEELHSVNEELFTVNTEYQRKIEELTQAHTDIENLLTCTEVGVIFLDVGQQIRMFTPAAGKAIRLRPQDLGRPVGELQLLLNIDSGELEALVKHVLANEKVIEREVRGPESSVFLMRILPYAASGVTSAGVILTFLDVSHLRRSEIEHAQLRARWESTIQELEDFAYAVAHDLRSPVRAISDYAQLARERKSVIADEAACHDVDRISSSANLLGRQLEALLAFTRVRTQANPHERINARDLLQLAMDNERSRIETAQADILIDDLPEIECDTLQMRTVFEELLTNSIKFRSDRRLMIYVRGGKVDAYRVWMEFQDNGQGFAPDQTKRAFSLFRRLVDKNHSPGEGVGLALARRIIEFHRGSIHSFPRPGEGCTIRIELPVELRDVVLQPSPGGSAVGKI